MKRLITTAMILSLLGGVAAEAAGAGQLDRRGGRQDGGERGPRPDNRVDGGERQQPQPQPQAQPPSPGGDRGDRGDRPNGGGGWNGGGRPAPQAQQPQNPPQAQAPRQGRDGGGWQGGSNQNGQGGRGGQGGSWGQDRPDEGRPDPGGRPDHGRPNRGRPDQDGRPGGWDRPGYGGRPDQGGRPGGWDRPGQGRPGDHGQWRDRDNDRQRYDQRRYRPAYQSSQRYRAGAYRYPRGFYVNRWSFGDYLPGGWYGQSYYLNAGAYGLPYPPAGCEWVRVGDDAILVDVWSGQVLSVYYDLFW